MKTTITPKILKGTRDFLPEQMAKRQYVMDKIITVFKRFGYDTIETPVIEYAETLLGKYGEAGSKLVYQFKDNGGRDIALRYDQTVPFARFVAQYFNDLPMPFKRYQISRVWRADKPAKGRYREFYQCDIDIIGTNALAADAEIAKVVSAVMAELGFDKYIIKFNSRRLINSILSKIAVPADKQSKVLQAFDKLDKMGTSVVQQELETFLDPATVEKLMSILIQTGSVKDKLKALQGYDISEIEQFIKLGQDFSIPDSALEFNPALARGLDYYTGIIYEVELPDIDIGSVCGGGRYDDLCGMFSDRELSGVGVAFGFDRLVLALEELGRLNAVGLNSQVLVTNFGEDTQARSIEVVTDIQSSGVNAELYFESAKLSKQFKYANQKQIPFVVMIGTEEVETNTATVKMMTTGKQKIIPQDQLAAYFKGLDLQQ